MLGNANSILSFVETKCYDSAFVRGKSGKCILSLLFNLLLFNSSLIWIANWIFEDRVLLFAAAAGSDSPAACSAEGAVIKIWFYGASIRNISPICS